MIELEKNLLSAQLNQINTLIIFLKSSANCSIEHKNVRLYVDISSEESENLLQRVNREYLIPVKSHSCLQNLLIVLVNSTVLRSLDLVLYFSMKCVANSKKKSLKILLFANYSGKAIAAHPY